MRIFSIVIIIWLIFVGIFVGNANAKWVMFEGFHSEYTTEQFYDDSTIVQIADLLEFSVLVKVDGKLKKYIQDNRISGLDRIYYVLWRYQVAGNQFTMVYTAGYNHKMEVLEEGIISYPWQPAGPGSVAYEMKKIIKNRF